VLKLDECDFGIWLAAHLLVGSNCDVHYLTELLELILERVPVCAILDTLHA